MSVQKAQIARHEQAQSDEELQAILNDRQLTLRLDPSNRPEKVHFSDVHATSPQDCISHADVKEHVRHDHLQQIVFAV